MKRYESDALQQQQKVDGAAALAFAGPHEGTLRQLQQMADRSDRTAVQRTVNNTGLPDRLKAGIESLSGLSMDHVKVHYNASSPAQMQAHAYAQGNQIHVAPGRERHVPHEAWHVVQQAQGRVHPTRTLQGNVALNDDNGLELEADKMGARALATGAAGFSQPLHAAATASGGVAVQRLVNPDGYMGADTVNVTFRMNHPVPSAQFTAYNAYKKAEARGMTNTIINIDESDLRTELRHMISLVTPAQHQANGQNIELPTSRTYEWITGFHQNEMRSEGAEQVLYFGLNRRGGANNSHEYWIAHLAYGHLDNDQTWMGDHEEKHRFADHHQRTSDEEQAQSQAIMDAYYASLPGPEA
jgi:hypothetical protein